MNLDEREFKIGDIALNRVKLRPFVIFNQVLQSGSILRAASQLHLTQPAVTKAIQELEEQLQVKLFTRKKKGVELTPEGCLLADRVNHLLTQLRYLVNDINSFRGGHSGHIVVGTLFSGSVQLLPQAIIELKRHHPGIIVTIRVGTIEELFPALENGELDIVVGRIPGKHSYLTRQYNLQHVALFGEKLRLIVSKHHPLLKQKKTKVEDMLTYPWILPLPSSEMYQMITEFFQSKQVTFPHNVIESMSLLTNIVILIESNAIGCVGNHVADYLIQNNALAVLPCEDLGQIVNVGYSFRSNEELSIACKKLITIIQKIFPNSSPHQR